MTNTSILAAFERMWQHVLALVGNKANKSELESLESSLTEQIENIDVSGKADVDHTHETAEGGFAGGTGTSATYGGAIGNGATTTVGGSVGRNTSSTSGGGAVGNSASTTFGGSVGNNTKSTSGFSGGNNAQSTVSSIQLGAGTNTEEYSLQIYSKQLMNGDGHIPTARLISHSETITNILASGTTNYTHNIAKTWTGGIPIVRSVNWVNGSSTYAAANIMFSVAEDDFNNSLKIRVQRPTGMSASTDVSYCLQIDILGV